MIRRFFLTTIVLFFATFFIPQTTSAAAGCVCGLEISGKDKSNKDVCAYQTQAGFPEGEALSPLPLLQDLPLSDCKTFLESEIGVTGSAMTGQVSSKETCAVALGASKENAAKTVFFEYSLTCSWGQLPAADTPTTPSVETIPLQNPLGNNTNIPLIIGKIIKNAMGILGAVALAVFVYGGFLWLISAGNSERVAAGTQAMTWAVIGVFIIFASYAILATVIQGLLGSKNPAVFVPQGNGCYCKFTDDGGVAQMKLGTVLTEKDCGVWKTSPTAFAVHTAGKKVVSCEWKIGK